MSARLRNVSRAQRSTSEAKWCAADTDLGFTRNRRLNVSKSGKPDLRGSSRLVAVPDQRLTAPRALLRQNGAPCATAKFGTVHRAAATRLDAVRRFGMAYVPRCVSTWTR